MIFKHCMMMRGIAVSTYHICHKTEWKIEREKFCYVRVSRKLDFDMTSIALQR